MSRSPAHSRVPALRCRPLNDRPVRPDGAYVLYWMTAARRTGWNFALDRALDWAVELCRPVLVFEPLRLDYPWASDRIHRFVIQGMAANQRRLRDGPAVYYPYVEPTPGAGRGLLAALAARASVIIADDWPGLFLPRMLAAAASRVPALLEAVDGNGLLPLRAADRIFPSAYAFRRFLHRQLPEHLGLAPREQPFRGRRLPRLGEVPTPILRRWPAADLPALNRSLRSLAIDHAVAPVPAAGGSEAAGNTLAAFLDWRLADYAELRNQPDEDATSGLSPYLHFGHLSAHQVFRELARREAWSPLGLGQPAPGSRTGWWRLSPSAEAFLDQLVTWRELGFNFSARVERHDSYEALPAWALATLARHQRDRRAYRYDLAQFAAAATHDPLWNAAQTQLLREGRIHGYLRMLWGKKILEWTDSPREALRIMIALNDRYAIDGRDPNSYSGIFWILGRYDRAWGPERPIFGTVRYMSSTNTARKVRVRQYLARYGEHGVAGTGPGV